MRFLPSPAPSPLARLPRRTVLWRVAGEVRKARPALPPESPQFHAAVLLLVVAETDFNAHRLVLRTGLPREFVARCLCRLAENGLWVDGQLRFTWLTERADAPDFWLDVDVALGKKLRRESASGVPEWAPAGGWVKEFEYRGAGLDRGGIVHARYHDPPGHNPGSAAAIGDHRAEAAVTHRATGPATPAQVVALSRGSGRRQAAMMVREWQEAHWLG